MGLIWSNGQAARSSPKEGGHLKKSFGGQYRNSGSPDGRKFWGDGGPIVVRKGKTFPMKGSRYISSKASLPAGFEKLAELNRINTVNSNHINTKVLDLLCDVDLLIAAYTKLKSSPGNMTPGLDSETLDGIDKL